MSVSFQLVHFSGHRVDAEATITANTLAAKADKEIVLQGTIDSIACRSDGEFIDSPVPFTVQYVEIAAVIPAYIIRVYDNEHHILLKDLQDGRLTTGSEEHLVRLLAERAEKRIYSGPTTRVSTTTTGDCPTRTLTAFLTVSSRRRALCATGSHCTALCEPIQSCTVRSSHACSPSITS